MKQKRSNKNGGFTLVELLVSIAILAILSAAVLGFVSAGTNSYRSISATVNLQTESQLSMNQVQQYLIDCNGGVCVVDNGLYILNREEDGTYTVHAFLFDSGDGTLTYSKNPVTAVTDLNGTAYSCDIAAGDPVSRHMTAFGADSGTPGTISSLALTMTLENSEKTYTATQTVALRNKVYRAVSLNSLLTEVCG